VAESPADRGTVHARIEAKGSSRPIAMGLLNAESHGFESKRDGTPSLLAALNAARRGAWQGHSKASA
jgi:hypothetical protein